MPLSSITEYLVSIETAIEEDCSSLTDKAYRLLEEQIINFELPPGVIVSETGLSQSLGIGRTPIREALQRLAREHLVEVLPRRGVVVSAINVKKQLKLCEVRRELERLLARSAARRANADERDGFRRLAEGMTQASESGDDKVFMRLDRAFNQLMSQAARNEFASNAMRRMHSLSRRFWYIHFREAGDMPRMAQLHALVALAVANGESAAAAAASDALMDYVEDFTRAIMKPA